MPKTGIHWYRHGLRIHDSPALVECLDEVERFIPIFIFDGKAAGTEVCGYNRYRFLLEALKDLELQFKLVGINFMCFYGQAHEVLEKLIKEYDVKIISFEKDSEAIWTKRDNLVKSICRKYDVEVIERVSHTLYDPEEIFRLNNGMPPNTFELLKKLCQDLGDPPEPVLKPDLKFYSTQFISTDDYYNENIHKVQDLDYFNVKPECPEQKVTKFKGGETQALALYNQRYQLEKELFTKGIVNPNLQKPLIFLKEIPLSPYFRFGCLSVRKFYHEIRDAYLNCYTGEKQTFAPAEQLLWREFFYHLSYKNEKFDQIDGNIMSFRIPWDWGRDDLFEMWTEGKTGFPWIDACMRQLKQEGWIHHACRNSVAVFFTRGNLFLSWYIGHRIFLRYLIDADWSVNAGNWNWVSSGDPEEIKKSASTICPVKNGKKIDPNGEYVRKFCPELKNFPLEYLFEPWKAPLTVQEEANCIIGRDYPEPCLDHEKASKENMIKLQQYYQSEKKDIFEIFRNDRNVIKPTNSGEYKAFTYAKFLESEFEDF